MGLGWGVGAVLRRGQLWFSWGVVSLKSPTGGEGGCARGVGGKDSSALTLPTGRGGILAMLDSLLFAPAVLLAMI